VDGADDTLVPPDPSDPERETCRQAVAASVARWVEKRVGDAS